jgi:hypothetical protein
VTRATRLYPKFKKGASIRAAIAMVGIAASLEGAARDRLRRAASAAMPTRVELHSDVDGDLESLLDELFAGLSSPVGVENLVREEANAAKKA